QTLTFSLGQPALPESTIDPVTGVFEWTPPAIWGPSTNLVSIIVTDSGVPSLSATQTFAIIVRDSIPDFRLGIGTTAILSNGVGSVDLSLQTGIQLTDLQLVLAVSGSRLTNLTLLDVSPDIGPASITAL